MNPIYYIYGSTVKNIYSLLKSWRKTFRGDNPKKIDRFIACQEEWNELKGATSSLFPEEKTIWIHASSLGEYQIARPIIAALKKRGDARVVVTFFSSTGIDALKGKNTEADIIMPLPLDTVSNSKKLLRYIKPDLAIFMVSEYWPNYLRQLHSNNIPVILYSALLRKSLTKGGVINVFKRKMLRSFDIVVCHDNLSENKLKLSGCTNVTKLPDPLFDNALDRTIQPYSDKVVETFVKNSSEVLVAGSLHMDEDLTMISTLAEKFPETKIILVPHETGEEDLEEILRKMGPNAVLYSEAGKVEDWGKINCLVIDFVGALAKLYRYGSGAYVGGGFTRLLHSVIEPLAYGISVSFGPMVYRKAIPMVMVETGIGTVVKNSEDLINWWNNIINGKENLDLIKKKAGELCEANRGGGEAAVKLIEGVMGNEI